MRRYCAKVLCRGIVRRYCAKVLCEGIVRRYCIKLLSIFSGLRCTVHPARPASRVPACKGFGVRFYINVLHSW